MDLEVSKGVNGTSNSYATVHKTHPNLEEPAPGPSRHPPGLTVPAGNIRATSIGRCGTANNS